MTEFFRIFQRGFKGLLSLCNRSFKCLCQERFSSFSNASNITFDISHMISETCLILAIWYLLSDTRFSGLAI